MQLSIRQKVMILAVLATIGYSLSFTMVKTYQLRSVTYEQQRLKLDKMASVYLQVVGYYQNVLPLEATNIAALPGLPLALAARGHRIERVAAAMAQSTAGSRSSVTLLGADGERLYGADVFTDPDQSILDVDGIAQTLAGAHYYGTSLIAGKFYQLATAPVMAGDEVLAVVAIAVPLLRAPVFKAMGEVTGLEVALQYREHLLGLSAPLDKAFESRLLEALPAMLGGSPQQYLPGATKELEVGGGEYLIVPLSLGNNQTLLLYSEVGMVSASAQRVTWLILFWGVLGLVIGVFFSGWAARLVSQPIEAFTAAARRLGAGDVHARANWTSSDEFGSLGLAFDRMADHVEADRAELLAKTEAAEEASRAKSTFLATMSHEIRTPLNGVLGMAQIISNGIDDPGQKHNLEVMMQSGRDLLDVIDGILDFSKIEANKLRLSATRFNLHQFMLELCDNQSTIARSKGLVFNASLPSDIAVAVEADPIWLRRILINLVGNAIKFTREGEVSVAVELLDRSPGVSTFEFSVHDTGIGIPQDRIDVIFESFAQADDSTTREYGGSGLGLAICRHLVEMMGGTIGVSSVQDAGTRFTFVLALKVYPAAEVASGDSQAELSRATLHPTQEADAFELTGGYSFTGRKVLVVEDSALNAEIARAMIERIGCEVDIAESGAVALQRVGEEHYDLVFMDCQMPVMDGFEATRTIRERESQEGSRRLPIVAFTAGAMSGNREVCRQAGMDDYITKPVTEKQIEDVLKVWLIDMADIA